MANKFSFVGEIEDDFLLWRQQPGGLYTLLHKSFYEFNIFLPFEVEVSCVMFFKFWVDRWHSKPANIQLLSYDLVGARFDLEKIEDDLPHAFKCALRFDRAQKYHVSINEES
jgi:hypothetical protein